MPEQDSRWLGLVRRVIRRRDKDAAVTEQVGIVVVGVDRGAARCSVGRHSGRGGVLPPRQ
jgi:hypothetical protein